MSEPPKSFMRQFAHTRGRVRSDGVEFPLDTLVKCTPLGEASASRLALVQRSVIEATRSPISVAEVAARVGVHLGVARVIVGDLQADGLVAMSDQTSSDGPDLRTLEQLLADLDAI